MSTSGKTTSPTGKLYDPHATGRMESLAGLPLAPFGRRFAAFLIDIGVVILAWAPLTFAVMWVLHRKESHLNVDLHWDFHEPSNVVFTLLYFGLSVYFSNGRTIGKRLLGIRVVSLVHERITFWQAIERALGYGASILEGGFGFVQFFTNPNRCCVHDRIAETIVIKD